MHFNGLFQLPSPFTLNGLARQTVSLKSEKFENELGRLAPASEVAEGHTLPF
jgi:hypothetical protein